MPDPVTSEISGVSEAARTAAGCAALAGERGWTRAGGGQVPVAA